MGLICLGVISEIKHFFTPFYVFSGHFSILFCDVLVQISCSFFYCSIYFFNFVCVWLNTHNIYHLNHCYVYSLVTLGTFTLLSNYHHHPSLEPFHLPKLYILNNNSSFLPPPVPGNHHSTVCLSVYSKYLS